MMLGPVSRALAIAFTALGVLLAVMTARALVEARAANEQATVAQQRGELPLTIAHLRTAARWYAPFNVYSSQALQRLEQLAQQCEARGDREHALSAYRSIHAAIMATRSFYTPHRAELARADRQIARLMAAEPPAPMEAQQSSAQREADYLALLQPNDPNPLGVLLAFAGFVTWVGSAVMFLTWGVDREGRILKAVARRSAACLLVGWIAFAVGLRIA